MFRLLRLLLKERLVLVKETVLGGVVGIWGRGWGDLVTGRKVLQCCKEDILEVICQTLGTRANIGEEISIWEVWDQVEDLGTLVLFGVEISVEEVWDQGEALGTLALLGEEIRVEEVWEVDLGLAEGVMGPLNLDHFGGNGGNRAKCFCCHCRLKHHVWRY